MPRDPEFVSNRPDVLTDVLSTLELRGWLHSRSELAAPWRFDFAAGADCVFHVLDRGAAVVYIGGDATPRPVEAGDVVVFPRGDAHTICDAPGSVLTAAVQLDYRADRSYQVLASDPDAELVMLCGAFHFDSLGSQVLLRRLPAMIRVRGATGSVPDRVSAIVGQLAAESAAERPGADVMLRKLAETLFIEVVRTWIEQQPPEDGGWWGALADPVVGAALALMHDDPGHRWTVRNLAQAVALSRSVFAERFTPLVGEPPLTYLTRWRMHMAMRLLRAGVSPAAVAGRVGYDSEVAFRKAFRREAGTTPARFRRERQAGRASRPPRAPTP